MASKSELKKFRQAVATIKAITRVYEQAAAKKMKEVKQLAKKAEAFLAGALEVYGYSKEALLASREEKMKKNFFRQSNSKTILVFISSQQHFYGNLINSVYQSFIEDVRKNNFDVLIAGATGKMLYQRENLKKKVVFYDLKDDDFDWNQIQRIVDYIKDYDQIFIYYEEFISVFKQISKVENIAETILKSKPPEKGKKYLLEDSTERALEYLEDQAIEALFQMKLYEAQLAKYGAKIKVLELAQVAGKISDLTTSLSRKTRLLNRRLRNKKQIDILSGYQLWGDR